MDIISSLTMIDHPADQSQRLPTSANALLYRMMFLSGDTHGWG